ncbi:MAG TPA: lipocalin family protein [Caulobacteraceae bacterium]|nr:lipocalin family protein [Caulobacteraceae bacterium]
MKLVAALCALALTAWALPAGATAQLQPASPVPENLYSGRWYEIARTPNHMQEGCQASTTDFARWSAGAFQAVQTCHQGARTGPAKTVTVSGRVLPASNNAKMQLAMLGGLITQQYWILDHAADGGWLIMTTPNDHYVWLMSRQPALTAADRATALARMQQLGLDLTRLAFQ